MTNDQLYFILIRWQYVVAILFRTQTTLQHHAVVQRDMGYVKESWQVEELLMLNKGQTRGTIQW